MIKLNNKIKVVVPKEDNAGKAINCSIIDCSLRTVTGILGGATTYDGAGQWISSNGHLMTDNVSVTEWSYDLIDLIEKDKLRYTACFVSWIVDALISFHGQEAVSVERDGVLYIIDKNDIVGTDGYTDSDKATDLIQSIMKGEI